MKTIATASLPAAVSLPAYDRDALKSRIVHLGFGAFHRAHQVLLTNRVLNLQGGDWGICEISLFGNEALIKSLRQQDHLFTVLEKGAEAIRRLSLVLLMNLSTAVSTGLMPCWKN